MFWGITPALDLLTEYEIGTNIKDLPEQINILLVGSTDARHILKTIAKRYRHKKVKINFYVFEICMETVAKQLLLLITAFQPQESLGLDQKTKVFMELYGNTLIRPYTSKYLASVARDLVKMITDYDYLKEKLDFVQMEVKYKERDYLENLVKFWCGKDQFNIADIWDRRLRKSLGIRYDSKIGAFDWDLHMRMHVVGGKQVCNQEYQMFRSKGVAFSWMESEVSRPNRSLVCAILPNGENFAHYGYLGDMETGPFISFGLECDDDSFLKSTNGQNAYRSTDVTERNLKQLFYEIEQQKEYEHTMKNDMHLGCSVMRQGKIVLDVGAAELAKKEIKACTKVEDVSIKFVSMATLNQMKYKEKFENFFDVVYFANNYLKHFEANTIQKIGKDRGYLLIVEHQLFVMSHRKKDLEEYAKNVKDRVKDINLTQFDFNVEKDSYMKFLIRNK